MDDGGFVIGGEYSTPLCNSHGPATPTVIRLADSGDMLWRHDYSFRSPDPGTQSPDRLSGIVHSMDNNLYLISQYGMIIKIDTQGNPVWSKNISSEDSENFYISGPPLQTHDGGILIGGSSWQCSQNSESSWCGTGARHYMPFVTKLDRDGNQSWFTKISDKNFWNVITLIELPNNQGYIGLGQNTTGTRHLFELDNNGLLFNSSSNDSIKDIYQIHSTPEGFSAFSVNRSMNNTLEELSFTNEGKKPGVTILSDMNPGEIFSDGHSLLATRDNHYLTINLIEKSIDTPRTTTTVYARELNREGHLIWDQQVAFFTTSSYRVHIRNVIETTDGDYLIVLGIQKERVC